MPHVSPSPLHQALERNFWNAVYGALLFLVGVRVFRGSIPSDIYPTLLISSQVATVGSAVYTVVLAGLEGNFVRQNPDGGPKPRVIKLIVIPLAYMAVVLAAPALGPAENQLGLVLGVAILVAAITVDDRDLRAFGQYIAGVFLLGGIALARDLHQGQMAAESVLPVLPPMHQAALALGALGFGAQVAAGGIAVYRKPENKGLPGWRAVVTGLAVPVLLLGAWLKFSGIVTLGGGMSTTTVREGGLSSADILLLVGLGMLLVGAALYAPDYLKPALQDTAAPDDDEVQTLAEKDATRAPGKKGEPSPELWLLFRDVVLLPARISSTTPYRWVWLEPTVPEEVADPLKIGAHVVEISVSKGNITQEVQAILADSNAKKIRAVVVPPADPTQETYQQVLAQLTLSGVPVSEY